MSYIGTQHLNNQLGKGESKVEASNFITYFDNVLPEKFCKSLITKFNRNKKKQVLTETENHRRFKEIDITANNWKKEEEVLLGHVQTYFQLYSNRFNVFQRAWPLEVGFENFRMKMYEPGDGFELHTDVGDYASARRFLVFFFYLNTVKEGGETAFQSNVGEPILTKVSPVQGRLIVFPPLWTHPHIGMTPVDDKKYIIGTYLHYV